MFFRKPFVSGLAFIGCLILATAFATAQTHYSNRPSAPSLGDASENWPSHPVPVPTSLPPQESWSNGQFGWTQGDIPYSPHDFHPPYGGTVILPYTPHVFDPSLFPGSSVYGNSRILVPSGAAPFRVQRVPQSIPHSYPHAESPSPTEPSILANPLPGESDAQHPESEPHQITIENPGEHGIVLNFRVNGQTQTLAPGEQFVHSSPDPILVEFHRGGNFGVAHYQLSTGLFRFHLTPLGWSLQ